MAPVDQELANEFRRARARQMDVANSGGGTLTTFFDSKRTELSFGGAPFGEHALSAFLSAKHAVWRRADNRLALRELEKRQQAARKGWKTRRAKVSA